MYTSQIAIKYLNGGAQFYTPSTRSTIFIMKHSRSWKVGHLVTWKWWTVCSTLNNYTAIWCSIRSKIQCTQEKTIVLLQVNRQPFSHSGIFTRPEPTPTRGKGHHDLERDTLTIQPRRPLRWWLKTQAMNIKVKIMSNDQSHNSYI
jgi:hypothetical protein